MTEVTEDTLIRLSPAPRVTLAAIEANIIAEHYFTAYEGRMGSIVEGTYQTIGSETGTDLDLDSLRLMTFCVLVLTNGYTVHGISACADPANFNQDIGRSIARKNAVDQIWPLMGFELKTKLHYQEQIENQDSLGKALTMLLAHSFGNLDALKPEDAKVILSELIPQNVESNEDIARIAYEAVRAWDALNGRETPDWASVDKAIQDIAIQQVAHYRAYPEDQVFTDQDTQDHRFKDKLFRTIVGASCKSPLPSASNRKSHLKLVPIA